GTPGPSNLIYSDGTSSAQTLSDYKSGVFTAGTIAPRDALSISELPPFLSTTAGDVTFLHINPAVPTQLESGGTPAGGITDDFDGNTRSSVTPDIGAYCGSPRHPESQTPPPAAHPARAPAGPPMAAARRNRTARSPPGRASAARSPPHRQ